MATYIITFEVTDTNRKNTLEEKLKEYDTYCAIHGNCWAIVSDQDVVEVRDYLWRFLTSSDRMFVIRSGTLAAWSNTYSDNHSKWLKEKL